MANHLEGSRNSCALHGALLAIEAIEGAVPVIHSTAGCGVQHFLGVARPGGKGDRTGSPPLSSSNIGEKHVVFGGGSRLREQLKNTVKVVRGDLYAIVTGCATEMVGDDIPAMAKEGREQGFPVIHANTPGFRGDVHQGYLLAVRALLEQLPGISDATDVTSGTLVNIWGIIPRQDPWWQGHLEELGRLVASIGLVPNLLFGAGEGVAAWQRVPHAALNLVVSPWGAAPAEFLAERYGTPCLTLDGLPVGAAAGRLLEVLTEQLGLDPAATAKVREHEEQRLNGFIAGLADTYYGAGFQREFALVGESALVAGVAEFLTRTLGLLPRTLIITDNPPEVVRERLTGQLQGFLDGYGTEVLFAEDRAEIADRLHAGAAELILGSALEREVATDLGVPFLQVSFPVDRQVVLNRGYAGYRGAVTLLEDLGSAILSGGPHASR